jgi:nitrogen fixation protein FixH
MGVCYLPPTPLPEAVPEAASTAARPRFNLWPWSPLFVIGAAIIANVVLYRVASQVHVEKVEAQPYVASSRIDAEKRAAERFRDLGYACTVKAIDQLHFEISITNNTTLTAPATVFLYRPNSSAKDHQVSWSNPTQPLLIPVEKPGLWRLRVEMPDQHGAELRAESAIDTSSAPKP